MAQSGGIGAKTQSGDSVCSGAGGLGQHSRAAEGRSPHLMSDVALQQLVLWGRRVPKCYHRGFVGDPEGHKVSHTAGSWGGGSRVLQ